MQLYVNWIVFLEEFHRSGVSSTQCERHFMCLMRAGEENSTYTFATIISDELLKRLILVVLCLFKCALLYAWKKSNYSCITRKSWCMSREFTIYLVFYHYALLILIFFLVNIIQQLNFIRCLSIFSKYVLLFSVSICHLS